MIQQRNQRFVADRTMGAFLVVVLTPIFQLFLGVCKAQEPVGVQTFRSEAAVERFDEGIVGRLSGPREVECHATLSDCRMPITSPPTIAPRMVGRSATD